MVSLYALLEGRPGNPNFGKPFYIGIGTATRPRKHIQQARSPQGCRNRLLNLTIREHLTGGFEPTIEIVTSFATRAEADAAERAMIALLGRLGRDEGGILCNVARGGDGPDSALMNDPEILAKISAATKMMFTNPEYRAAHSSRLKAAYADPAARERLGAQVKIALREPETRERHVAALALVNAALTPEQRRAAEASRTPDSKARSLAALTASRTDPEIQARRRENSREPQKNSWADPEIRARRVAAMKGKKKTMSEAAVEARKANAAKGNTDTAKAAKRAAIERNWADPEFRAMRSRNQAAAWQDPEKRARMLAGRSEAITKSWEDPEIRNRRIAAQKASRGVRE